MAKVDRITGDNIERFRGMVDFYLWKGKIPVARRWPKKPKPPYTALQAEAMAAFSLTCGLMRRVKSSILTAWQVGQEGKREQWTDSFKGFGMKYWKKYGDLAPVAIDYSVSDDGDTFRVNWTILTTYIDGITPEVESDFISDIITKADLSKTDMPVYFTLYDNDGTRLIAPFIKLEV